MSFEIDPDFITEELANDIATLLRIYAKLRMEGKALPDTLFTPTVNQLKDFFKEIDKYVQLVITSKCHELVKNRYGFVQIIPVPWTSPRVRIELFTTSYRSILSLIVPYREC